jgi:hypothetical protein
MTRHLTDIEIESYRRRAIVGEALVAANDHLAECDECYQRFRPASDLGRVCTSLVSALAVSEAEFSGHLTTEDICSYVDRVQSIDGAERCRTHIALCPECREDIDYLTGLPFRAAAPAAGPGSLSTTSERRGRAFAGAAGALLARPAYRFAALATLLLVVAGVAVSLAALGLRTENRQLKAQLDELRAENATLNEKASEAEQLRSKLAQDRDGGASDAATGVIVSLRDSGRLVQLKKDSTLTGFESAPADYQQMAKDALATQKLKTARMTIVDIGREGPLMGEQPKPNGFTTVSPAGEAIESARPTFSWTDLPGAASYTVFVRDLKSGAEVRSDATQATRWTPSADLIRGHTYAWMVEASLDGHLVRAPATNEPLAQFKVIGSDEAEEIRMARSELPGSHLLMGLIYARAGLRSEAQRELKALVEANPDSETARKLYQSVRAR